MNSLSGVAPTVSTPFAGTPVVAVQGLTKRFGDVVAADRLDLRFFNGEIHAVLGENGAGKSTFMKMLYGYYRPDRGQILLDGHPVVLTSPADALQRGIGMVFQNFTLIPAMTVLENMALFEKTSSVFLRSATLRQRIEALSAKYGLDVDADAQVRDLSVGEQQRVEILKMLASGPRILILDEPTSVLTLLEADALLESIRRLRDSGYAVILITHKLREVFACADRVTVLRHGAVAGTGSLADFDQPALLALMVGDRATDSPEEGLAGRADVSPGIGLHDLSVQREAGGRALEHVTLNVARGEIVGVAAVSGNGQAALGDAILGTGHVVGGSVSIGGTDVTRWSPAARLDIGLTLVPEDPVRNSGVADMRVSENLMITRAEYHGRGSFLLRPRVLARTAELLAKRSPFAMPSPRRVLGTLSGGNLQRVVLTRELADHCRYLVAYSPARGLDVASTRTVHQQLLRMRARGAAVLLISEDLDELMALSDRIAVVHHGRIAGVFTRRDADVLEIARLMTGATS